MIDVIFVQNNRLYKIEILYYIDLVFTCHKEDKTMIYVDFYIKSLQLFLRQYYIGLWIWRIVTTKRVFDEMPRVPYISQWGYLCLKYTWFPIPMFILVPHKDSLYAIDRWNVDISHLPAASVEKVLPWATVIPTPMVAMFGLLGITRATRNLSHG